MGVRHLSRMRKYFASFILIVLVGLVFLAIGKIGGPDRSAAAAASSRFPQPHARRSHNWVLHTTLHVPLERVHAEAERIEHAISDDVAWRIATLLRRPACDPHGHPIPTAEGVMARRELRSLAEGKVGQRVLIREVKDDSPERLRRWRTLGLTPGAVVCFIGHEPLDDLFQLQLGDKIVALGSEGLAGLLGEVLPDE